MSTQLGARPSDWHHWDLVLGMGQHLLPVVPDPNAPPSTHSSVKVFGKIPSVYRGGDALGLAKWTERAITPDDIARWRADPRLGMCVRTAGVRALDIDVTDGVLSDAIASTINAAITDAPYRVRSNSRTKFLVPFLLDAPLKKRIINTAHGRIELLADGQQFVVAGTHPSGARYEWTQAGQIELPSELPVLTLEQLDALWSLLDNTFGIEPQKPVQESAVSTERVQAPVLNTIDKPTLADLREALSYKPLLEAAADNSFWSEIGYSLLSLGAQGRALWLDFSRRAPNFEPGAAEQWWERHQ